MNALPKSGVSSNPIVELLREYANDPANQNKIIGSQELGASKPDILQIKEALHQEYGEKITSIAFPQQNQEHAIQHGISTHAIKVIFARADFEQAKEFPKKADDSLIVVDIGDDGQLIYEVPSSNSLPKSSEAIEMTLPNSDQSTNIVSRFADFIKLRYGKENAEWAFTPEMRERSLVEGLSKKMVNEIVSRAEVCTATNDFSAGLRGGEKFINESAPFAVNINSEKMYDPKNLYTQPPLSQSERNEIIVRQENHATKKQNEALSPIAETDETKGEDIVLSELDDNQKTRSVPVKKSEFGDIPTSIGEKSDLLGVNAKIFHDWQFLRLDIEEAKDKSSNAWVQREFQKEYGDQDLSLYRRNQLLEPLEARRKEAEQRLDALNVQLSQLERAHPFLKAEQTQRKEVQQRVHEHLADPNAV